MVVNPGPTQAIPKVKKLNNKKNSHNAYERIENSPKLSNIVFKLLPNDAIEKSVDASKLDFPFHAYCVANSKFAVCDKTLCRLNFVNLPTVFESAVEVFLNICEINSTELRGINYFENAIYIHRSIFEAFNLPVGLKATLTPITETEDSLSNIKVYINSPNLHGVLEEFTKYLKQHCYMRKNIVLNPNISFKINPKTVCLLEFDQKYIAINLETLNSCNFSVEFLKSLVSTPKKSPLNSKLKYYDIGNLKSTILDAFGMTFNSSDAYENFLIEGK